MLKNLLGISKPKITDALDIANGIINSTNMMLDIMKLVSHTSPIASKK